MNAEHASHDRAMDLAFPADRSRAAGNLDEAGRLYAQALESELAALGALRDLAPTTSAVMHGSAAWLAVECGKDRPAEELASAGLAAHPPQKSFECMKWLRETRDRINEELEGMSLEEQRRWFNRRPSDPALAEWWESIPESRIVKPHRIGAHDGREREG